MTIMEGGVLTLPRRLALLSIAAALVAGCGILTFTLRAIPKREMVGVVLAVLYVLAASGLTTSSPKGPSQSAVVTPLAQERKISRFAVRLLLVLSLVVSIVLPWVWITFFSPTEAQLAMIAPHLFLMMTQVLFEIWSYRASISIVVRIAIPVAFVSYRVRLLHAWLTEAWMLTENTPENWAMKTLASANFLFWTVVLFYVLLLKVCPPYFPDRAPKKKMTGSNGKQSMAE